jgi:hypothetical protein
MIKLLAIGVVPLALLITAGSQQALAPGQTSAQSAGGAPQARPAPARAAAASCPDARPEWYWRRGEGSASLAIKISGEAQFTDDYSDIESLTAGGSVSLEERRGTWSRRYEVKRGRDDNLQRDYFVNGQPRALDAEARSWITETLLGLVRQTGMDAPARVPKIMQRGGPGAVLSEISRLRSDHARRRYFNELFRRGGRDAHLARRVLRQVAAEVHSDYEKARVLSAAAAGQLHKAAWPAFFEAAGTIASDYERGRVLAAVLKTDPPGREVLTLALRSAAGLSSDHEKARVLIKAVDVYTDDPKVRAAYFAAVDTIRSDYQRGRVLSALLRRDDLSHGTKTELLKSAARIASDYEKTRFLLRMIATGDSALRSELLAAAQTIRSDNQRGRVVSALGVGDVRN